MSVQLEKIKEIKDVKSVETIKIDSFGKYIEVNLNCKNNRLINKYEKYLLFKQENSYEIDKIYNYLEEKVDKNFIASYYFKNNICFCNFKFYFIINCQIFFMFKRIQYFVFL